MRAMWALAFGLLLCAGCKDAFFLDEVVRLNEVQMLGTHNSYHLQPDNTAEPWAYSHAPLYDPQGEDQLSEQSVRHLELDLWFDDEEQRFRVFHLALLDPISHCVFFEDCLESIASFSRENSTHLPVFVMLEFKNAQGRDDALALLEHAEECIETVFAPAQLLVPDEVRKDSASLRDAVAQGWPHLGEVRGKSVFIVDGAELAQLYSDAHPRLQGRTLFVQGDPEAADAAFVKFDDPLEELADIENALSLGQMVRTRADVDTLEARGGDFSRAENALQSGAHFISTDFAGQSEFDYRVVVSDEYGLRCNPGTASADCENVGLEPSAQ